MTGKLKDLTINRDETQNITVTVDTDFREMFDKLKNEEVFVEIKRLAKKRSMNANDYFWHVCSEIAKASSQYSTVGKNDVYREAVKAKGEFEPLLVRKDALDTFIKRWGNRGTGWFAEVVDDWKEKYAVVHAYYGSSTYTSATMSHIIDYVVNIANDLGIPTITGTAEMKMLETWAEMQGEKSEQVNTPAG